MAEWWYNTNYHSSLRTTPYQALYEHPPPNELVINLGMDTSPIVQEWGREQERMIRLLKEKPLQAQNSMKQNANKRRINKEYQVGEYVYLKLQPYRQVGVAVRRNLKLSARYYGPFEIIEKIGQVAYRLRLLEGSRIHPVFHVSLLNRSPSVNSQVTPMVPLVRKEGQLLARPEKILERRVVNQGNRAVSLVLVKWENLDKGAATWEDYWFLKSQFPDVDSEPDP